MSRETAVRRGASVTKNELTVPPSRHTVGLLSLFVRIFKRDLLLSVRSAGQSLNPVLFFVIVVTLFPLGIGPGAQTLATIAPGILWVSALLAMMLSLDVLFANDFRDGTLEQLVLSGQPLSVIVLAKVLAYWVSSALPLVVLSPLLALFMQLPVAAIGVLIVSLIVGTLALSFIGAIGAALIVSLNQAGILLSLLVLPLTVPVLVFGSGAVSAASLDLPVSTQLSVLYALLALAASLAPWAISGALRVGVAAGR
ncbi:MAG: heme exporter protein CcmB [Granulosicoccus sp.]|nr:heme exporter protein CcmB [Granulosicoccus sp.]